MWIISEGEVRVERGGPGTDEPRENLGKLSALEFFGELAVCLLMHSYATAQTVAIFVAYSSLVDSDAGTGRRVEWASYEVHPVSICCNWKLHSDGFEPP